MARPSVADERIEQILEATLATIAEHGISGSTLDRVADTAKMSRGHVRHFVGNRDRLFCDAARYFYSGDGDSPAILPSEVATLGAAVDYLFGAEFTASSSENAIVLAFVELSRSSEEIAKVLNEAYSSTRMSLVEFIAEAKPHVSAVDCEWGAEGLLSIALGNVFLGDFNADPAHTERTRTAALAMLSALDPPEQR